MRELPWRSGNRVRRLFLKSGTLGFQAGTLVAVLALLLSTGPVVATAAGAPCSASKLLAAGRYAADQTRCSAMSAIAEAPTSSLCRTRAVQRFTKAWSRAEAATSCLTNGDSALAQADVDAFIAALTDRLLGRAARYTYTGAVQTFHVPSGVTSVVIKAWGAGGGGRCGWGGDRGSHGGGGGGFAQARVPVVQGETLAIVVGGGGGGFSWDTGSAGGFGGGGDGGDSTWAGFGGGGGSEVARGSTSLVVAGGGGGAGDRCGGAGYGGPGGGGNGGIEEGGSSTAGTGASTGAGGIAGLGGSGGTDGARGQGGLGNSGGYGGGGGGGGGYFGGGGGGAGYEGAGGGGGSSFASGSDQLVVAADRWLAGNASDPDYIAPLGEGGQYDGPQEGQPGLVLIRY